MSNWNFADVWEAVAEKIPDAPALAHGGNRTSWAEFNSRASALAGALVDLGLDHQDKVAIYLYNRPEYLETVFASLKASYVPINTNYRYGVGELEYLWENADTKVVVFQSSFEESVNVLRDRLPQITTWIWVADSAGDLCPEWAHSYEGLIDKFSGSERVNLSRSRSGDDLIMLYTGGTTGMPKGVMWRQDDLFGVLNNGSLIRFPEHGTPDDVRKIISVPGPIHLSACPLMHGTGCFTAFVALNSGGCVATLASPNFSPEELLDCVEQEKINVISLVGDAFAKPILKALDERPGNWDLSSLRIIISSGVMFSEGSKQRLLGHHPAMLVVDAFSSSEAMGLGQSVSSAGGQAKTASFSIGEFAKVIDEDGNEIEPGSGLVGKLAVRGRTPIGYYKDPEKSAKTFPVIDGVRWSVPGDYAQVDADGTVHVLGRGSQCINTGGEKVYPEEVEEVLKLHPVILDCAVVGVPSDKFGEEIWALVQFDPGESLESEDVSKFVKSHLAGYKAPKRTIGVTTIGRSPSGKVDYKKMRDIALAELNATSSN